MAVSLILWRVKQKRKGHTQLKLAPSQYFSWVKDMVRSWRKVLWYLHTILQGNPKKTLIISKVCLDVVWVNVSILLTKWKSTLMNRKIINIPSQVHQDFCHFSVSLSDYFPPGLVLSVYYCWALLELQG